MQGATVGNVRGRGGSDLVAAGGWSRREMVVVGEREQGGGTLMARRVLICARGILDPVCDKSLLPCMSFMHAYYTKR